MRSRSSFTRKIVYLVAIAVLLMPLFWLSQPATHSVKGASGSAGGVLARLRDEHHLSEAQLGQVDPTSATIKLATLGLRGVAANILWEKAIDYKMKKDWTNFGATLNQITKVQPNFINVWSNQAWNLAYNISVEFDDYRQRYHWVIKGIEFLKEGIRYNEREPRLLWDLGGTISSKIGKADESKQFRKLFKEDDNFHGSLPLVQRDNWLVGKTWFDRAVDMVDKGARMMGQSPLIYRSSGPMCQMSYAEGVEKDGTFGQVAKRAWSDAAAEWHRYGDEEIPTTFKNEKTQEAISIRLNEEEMHAQRAKDLIEKLDALQPGLRDKLIAEKRAKDLSDAERNALDTPLQQRTGNQFELASRAEEKIAVTHREVARRIAGPKRSEAKAIAKEATDEEELASYIRRYREIVNFEYWRLRGEIEQSEEMLNARKLIHQGDLDYAEAIPVAARSAYEQGLKVWRTVLDKYPSLVSDQTTNEELIDVIKRYRSILNQLDERFPEDFILQDVIDAHEKLEGGPAKSPAQQATGKGEPKN